MAFLNPLLLFGTLAIASPIIIHLLARQRVRKVLWAAMRFLKMADERNRQRMRLEEIILLVMRCVLLALLAFALARPALRKAGVPGFSSNGSDETALILIDTSLSTAQTDGGASRFEQAQQAAEQIVDALPAGASIAVWTVSDGVDILLPEPTRDAALVRKMIRDAERTDRASDLPPAIQRGLELLRKQRATVKQLFIVTDGQALAWKGVGGAANSPAIGIIKERGVGILANVVLVGEAEPRNLAITDVRLASALAAVNASLRFEIEVTNFGADDVQNVPVSLAVDSEPPGDEQAIDAIPAGASKRIALHTTFREPGAHTVTAHIASDRCPADDARTLALRVLDEVRVLLVDGEPGAEPRESEVFYLRHALTPVPPEARSSYLIKPQVISAGELEAAHLADFDALILANVVDFSDAAVASVESFVRAGGGLIVFPGARTNAAFYNAKLSGLLPAAFGEARGDAVQQDKFFTLQGSGYEHPIVDLWKDPAAGSLASAHFFRAFALTPAAPDPAKRLGPPLTVLRYADGEPAVVERTVGSGRVIQFSSTADSAWNDLCVRPIFVPLMHRTLGALLGKQDEKLNLRTGTPLVHMLPVDTPESEVRVIHAGDEKPIPGRIRRRDGLPALEFAETDRSGAYEVHLGDDATPMLRFATQPDAAESRLDELTPADVKALEAIATVTRWTGSFSLRETLVAERSGSELWAPLAILAFLLAVAETLLGNLWSRSK